MRNRQGELACEWTHQVPSTPETSEAAKCMRVSIVIARSGAVPRVVAASPALPVDLVQRAEVLRVRGT